MTYGWALLVIAVVIAVLVVINPFSAPTVCKFDSLGFVCDQPTMDSNGKLYVLVTNTNNNDIALTGIACVADRATVPPAAMQDVSMDVPRQSQIDTSKVGTMAGASGVVCRNSGGGVGLPAGSDFTGKLWLRYRNSEDPATYPNRTAGASISMKVVQAS
jgi:hypothetical protein